MLGWRGCGVGYGGGVGPTMSARVGPLGGSAIINSLNSKENLSMSTQMDSMSSKCEREREREREGKREVFGGQENEGKPKTLKRLKAFFF